MKTVVWWITALGACSALACGSIEQTGLRQLAIEAVSDDPVVAAEARHALRDHGQAGVDVMRSVHAAALASAPIPAGKQSGYARVREALDEIAQQRDCHASGLYWHTDMAKAIAAARESGKPILSLRLLGKLNEELSCANSRFFRTTLYANAEVSKLLRERFVLHWQSVRPAPRITIDFGDGRKIERTITGNSIHYVLDQEGRPLDGLPGLHSPKAFMAALIRLHELAGTLEAAPGNRDDLLRDYHAERLQTITTQWSRDLAIAEGGVKQFTPALASGMGELRERSTDAVWTKIAALHAGDAVLDNSSRALIRAKNPNAWQAGRLTISKSVAEDPMLRMIRGLERSIAEDTVRNEYLLHAQIHQWFMDGKLTTNVKVLDWNVYARLFLTPHNDPWLGLVGDGFAGLEGNGVIAAAAP